MKEIIKYSGISLIVGGIFLIITNLFLTPFVDFEAIFSEVAKSNIFTWRMISAAITVSFLLFGTIGLYLLQSNSLKKFGKIAFILTFLGCTFLFGNEWYQIFVLPELAETSPNALDILDTSDDFSRYDIGAMLAITMFSLGWLLFSISMLTTKVLAKTGPIVIILGFLSLPILSSFLSPTVAGMIGNSILGIGFIILGRELILQ